jgi:hypothetical protein
MIRFLMPLLLTALVACKKSENAADLLASINRLTSEIGNSVAPEQCATQTQDCRLRTIVAPGACGLTYIYNIKDVDSVQLNNKFAELERLKKEYAVNNPIGPICDYYILDSLYIKDCKCVGGLRSR